MKRPAKQSIPLIIGASILFCCLTGGGIYGAWFYMTVPFPAPAPYPSSTVEQSGPHIGSGRRSIWFEYTATITLDEIQRYYEAEMKQYCLEGWQFVETDNACQGYTTCRVAECEIPRPFVDDAQFFLVYLRSISATQTNVFYIQTTIDP